MVLVWLDLIVRCNWMISGDGHREALGKGSSWGCGVIWTHQDSTPGSIAHWERRVALHHEDMTSPRLCSFTPNHGQFSINLGSDIALSNMVRVYRSPLIDGDASISSMSLCAKSCNTGQAL
jgi:hypothetical protein